MTTVADYALLAIAGYPRDPKNAGPPPSGSWWLNAFLAGNRGLDCCPLADAGSRCVLSVKLPRSVVGRKRPFRTGLIRR